MKILEILLIGVSLSMDAFAVSICKGFSISKINLKKSILVGLYFGVFQALMPAIGYFLGSVFANFIISIDHWVAFILLSLIGSNMIIEALKSNGENNLNSSLNFKSMLILAIATSIDALAIGITFAFLNVNLILAVTIIGFTTFLISIIGVNIGHKFGSKYGKNSGILGGIVLIIIGLKILLEHLGVFSTFNI